MDFLKILIVTQNRIIISFKQEKEIKLYALKLEGKIKS